jgi:two-component system response regulator MtrA
VREPSGRTRGTVLFVEDDPLATETLTSVLESMDYRVWNASTAAEAQAMLEHAHPDLIILDLALPDADGLVLCSHLKTIADVPIIICSATTATRDRVLGLKLGADDFISKPFDVDEFEARVEAVLRRSSGTRPAEPPERDVLRVGTLVLDWARRRVTLGGHPMHLTPTEYRLLATLMSRSDEVLTREELAQQVWGYYDSSLGRTIDVHIRRLRGKLGEGPVPPPAISSVRGFGYRIEEIEAPSAGVTRAFVS